MSNSIVDSSAQSFTELPPLSLYIHIPWCIKKCPYCDFNSHTYEAELPEQAYIRALITDLEHELIHVQGRSLKSIFFGGGTPSLFSADAIGQILAAVEKRISFSPAIEITLEANPGTAEAKKFADFKHAGINRLSIGVQSFDDRQLKKLGRIHDSHEAINAVEFAKRAGINNFNIDLMHGLESQTQQHARNDLQQAISLGATHISWYQLTIEANTLFYKAPPPLPNDEKLADIQDSGEAVLTTSNFQQYEVSAFAQAGKQSQHNLNYWQFGDYIALGAGAHGKITNLKQQAIFRYSKTRSPKDYLSSNIQTIPSLNLVPAEDLALEFMMNNLRLNDGFLAKNYTQRTGLPFDGIDDKVQQLITKGLLIRQGERIKPSKQGHYFLNSMLEYF